MLTPQLRFEYQREFSGTEAAILRYADLVNGPLYTLAPSSFDRNRVMLGLGLVFATNTSWTTRLEYRGLFGSEGRHDNGLQLGVEKEF